MNKAFMLFLSVTPSLGIGPVTVHGQGGGVQILDGIGETARSLGIFSTAVPIDAS